MLLESSVGLGKVLVALDDSGDFSRIGSLAEPVGDIGYVTQSGGDVSFLYVTVEIAYLSASNGVYEIVLMF